ncbi:TIGR03790 family protein [Luteolibacter arcticus]|uniref:TIGR03790 family protein n=1 Tax=Luteolibacter arcticus TaxID=1581411 RepID=A0ABT3GII8_9BACT|nr:TIGR03790 family protein [Luteolibacter arcticus]MCW1923348.1 TIGR03790 family protein [Luteolibacter arcticus]
MHALPTPPDPASVAVLYNSASADSKALAEFYAKARNIPADHLVGLELPDAEEISRKDFDDKLRSRLIREYDRREWWTRGLGPQGNLTPTVSKIRILVCMRGVPSRIIGTGPALPPPPGKQPFADTTQAAVDSELALLGIEGLQVEGFLTNPYFKQEKTAAEARLPMTLVGRIDGPTKEICAQMIKDAVEVEQTGLWGMSVIDLSQKYPESQEGDPAMEKIAKAHRDAGIPVMVDRFPDTLPVNYPLGETALYFGWYDWNVNGPFTNPNFKFKKGAVAVHLHSFSATQLRDATKNWAAPLLAKGAAATLGNVYEPYLALTHNFDIFNARLMAGYTLVEAAYMSVPVLSWQNVVLGDPLYRPFLHLDGSGEKTETDRDYRAIRLAAMRWKEDPKQMEAMLREAADRLKSGVLLEYIGLSLAARKEDEAAAAEFRKAKLYYTIKPDRLRMDMHLAAMERERGKKDEAIKLLRGARTLNADIPESLAAASWLTILDPPPPPPAQPQPPKK